MRIAEVIGTITLSRVHPTMTGARWVIGVPYSLKAVSYTHLTLPTIYSV